MAAAELSPDTTPTPDQPSFSDLASFVRATRVTGVAASRSGTVVATVRHIDEDGASFVDQLVAVEDDGATARLLTRGAASARLLAVGERGEVYFGRSEAGTGGKGASEKGDAVWMLPPRGEARAILRHRGGVESLHVSDRGLVLTVGILPSSATPEESDAATKVRADAKVSAVLHDRYPIRHWDTDLGPARTRVFTAPLPDLDTTDTEAVELTPVALPERPEGVAQWDVDTVVAVPDGSAAVVVMTARTAIDTSSQTWLVPLAGAAPWLLAAEDPGERAADFVVVTVSPDSTFAVVARETPPLPGQTVRIELWRVDLRTGERIVVAPTWDDDIADVAVGEDGTVWFTAERHGRGGVYRVQADGSAVLVTPDDEYAYSSLRWTAGHLVALRSSVVEPPRVVFLDPAPGGAAGTSAGVVVTPAPALGPDLDVPGELTEITATAEDGTPLRAWLAVPDGQGPHPFVVFAHGGPWGSWNDWTWRWNPWPFVARGYAVLLPDPGISVGYGSAMTARGHDSIGDQPFSDILALADAAVARPDIDETRQAFAGGSYGGYMANWVAGHTGTRFRCIVTHAGLWDIESMGLTTDNGSWYRWMTAPVDGGPSQAQRWSPHRFAHDIAVPMLVIHGNRDHRVPFSQALELWADLQRLSPELGHRFLYFPDEGHWILAPGNAEVWYQTFLAFLDQHVLGRPFKRPELLG